MGNGQRTVVSIKKYHAALKAHMEAQDKFNDAQVDLKRMEESLKALQSGPAPRPELVWFAGECEKVLLHHDSVKGDSYKQTLPDYLFLKILNQVRKMNEILLPFGGYDQYRPKIIRTAVNIANLAMMMAYITNEVEKEVMPMK
jgi:hypothetical protein